jgi:aminoglycoside phosphotransferase (APT) family kinase protein
VIEANLARSRRRLAAAGLFDAGLVEIVEGRLAAIRDEVDAMAAIPFLHDTTTKNVLVSPQGEFCGIVDVDDLCFGDPRYPAALTLAAMTAYGGPAGYVARWLHHAAQRDDRVFRLYVAVFLLDLMSEHGHAFNGNAPRSTPARRAELSRAFEATLSLVNGR